MNYDMDAFLNDLRDSQQQEPSYTMALALFHHLWKNHPLKIEPAVTLVALSENLVVDLPDIQYIRKTANDEILISLKANDGSLYIYPDTPEYEGVLKLMALFANHEH